MTRMRIPVPLLALAATLFLSACATVPDTGGVSYWRAGDNLHRDFD